MTLPVNVCPSTVRLTPVPMTVTPPCSVWALGPEPTVWSAPVVFSATAKVPETPTPGTVTATVAVSVP